MRRGNLVLEGRLELPRIAPLAPQASASAIPPPEHVICLHLTNDSFYFTPILSFVKPEYDFFHIFFTEPPRKGKSL